MRRKAFQAGTVLPAGTAAVFLAVSMAACSSGSSSAAGTAPSVASLVTQDARTAAGSSPAGTSKQLRERIDMTEAERDALQQPYLDCMKENGVDVMKSRGTVNDKTDAANEACEDLLPLPAWELDPANPEARTFAGHVRDCLKDRGIRYVEVNEDGVGLSLGGAKNDARSIELGLQYMNECEREAAAQK
ncbi:hypothetical protein [Kineosporia succinea]|uniref:Secreted protein n=1 Tax=Kineosporia succinea TaxID=84632 RepID=A0ABT9PDC0_9ACTN|nr:hypothetical protein [Kineosporia succinea]MDP9830706.1 hypothetical protein [Kineosporia succinea]